MVYYFALGAAAMIIAVNANTFAGMLAGLFIVALGFLYNKRQHSHLPLLWATLSPVPAGLPWVAPSIHLAQLSGHWL